MGVNKVVMNTPNGEETIIDLTSDSVTPETLAEGVTAHDASGEVVTGIMTIMSQGEINDCIEAEVVSQLDGAKADIVQQLIDALGGYPVFGTIDENKVITITSAFANGIYTLAIENEDGTVDEVCEFTYEGAVVEIVNLLETAVGADGAVFNSVGYMDGKYLTGSNNVTPIYVQTETGAAHFVTGYMPYTMAQAEERIPIYIKGTVLDISNNHERMGVYPSLEHSEWCDPLKLSSACFNVTELAEGYYKIIPIASAIAQQGFTFGSNINFIRFSLSGSGEGVVITIGQEIP